MEEREGILYKVITKFNELNNPVRSELSNYKTSGFCIKFRAPNAEEFKQFVIPTRSSKSQAELREDLIQYKILKSDAKLVQSVFECNNLKMTEGHNWNIIWCSGHLRSYVYDGISPYQRVNHFPGSYELTRKDNLCKNIVRMQTKYGKQLFDIIPDTFILPDDFNNLYAQLMQFKSQAIASYWIVKPNSMSRGRGIYIVILKSF